MSLTTNTVIDKEQEQEDLFQEMVSWVEDHGSEYAQVQWQMDENHNLIQVWCETPEGEIIDLPEKYWDVATKK